MNDKRFITVTNDKWSVSCTTGGSIDGAILHVARWPTGKGLAGKMVKGDADGKRFANSDLAFEYAYVHGYTQRYYAGPTCPHCKIVHMFLGHRSGWCGVTGTFC